MSCVMSWQTSGEVCGAVLAATPSLLTDEVAGEPSENFSIPTLRTVAPKIYISVLMKGNWRLIPFCTTNYYLHPSMFLLYPQDHHSYNYN